MLAVWLLADKDLSMQCPEVIVLRPPSPLNTPNQMRQTLPTLLPPISPLTTNPKLQLVNGVTLRNHIDRLDLNNATTHKAGDTLEITAVVQVWTQLGSKHRLESTGHQQLSSNVTSPSLSSRNECGSCQKSALARIMNISRATPSFG